MTTAKTTAKRKWTPLYGLVGEVVGYQLQETGKGNRPDPLPGFNRRTHGFELVAGKEGAYYFTDTTSIHNPDLHDLLAADGITDATVERIHRQRLAGNEPRQDPVIVTFNHHGSKSTSRYATLREALEAIDGAVEWNEAAPVSLTMPASVIGAPPVTFDAMQLYVMCELVREEEE